MRRSLLPFFLTLLHCHSPTGFSAQEGALSAASCLAQPFLTAVGKHHLLVGAQMEDASAAAAPFDLRYLYLSGGFFDGADPCAWCANACFAGGRSCANSNPQGCAWWGCWQYDQDPPGGYVRDFVAKAKAKGQVPMLTYYTLLQASGVAEGAAEVDKTNDAVFMRKYYKDFRVMLLAIGAERALVHIEPDFWGYAEQKNSDPSALPSAVASANPEDCAGQPNTLAGLGHCLIAMTRKYAPAAQVGLHASGWATSTDVDYNSDPKLDVAGEAKKLVGFLRAVGADQSDFIGLDACDRDAGYYDSIGNHKWWDDQNKTLPNFSQALGWAKAVSEGIGKPNIWWQTPVGNMQLANQNLHWRDNRLDYFFDHSGEIVAHHGVAIAFGAGASGQTTPESDGGNLLARVKAYAKGGGQPVCH